ncbi:MAG: GIY-YIG nuclease family protein [Bacteroidota bacterium]
MDSLSTPVTGKLAKAHVERHVAFLTNPKWALRLGQGKEWLKQFPTNPAVYCIFEGDDIIYAGETGSLKGRMRDLFDTRNHTLRRQLGNTKFRKHPSYQAASSSVKFPDDIEKLLTKFMLKHLKIKALPVLLGRKEIEEHLIDEKKPKYNTKGRRGKVLSVFPQAENS